MLLLLHFRPRLVACCKKSTCHCHLHLLTLLPILTGKIGLLIFVLLCALFVARGQVTLCWMGGWWDTRWTSALLSWIRACLQCLQSGRGGRVRLDKNYRSNQYDKDNQWSEHRTRGRDEDDPTIHVLNIGFEEFCQENKSPTRALLT